MITHCPKCGTELCDMIEARMCKDGKVRMRPLKKGWKCCALVACRRYVNIVTGSVWKGREVESESNNAKT